LFHVRLRGGARPILKINPFLSARFNVAQHLNGMAAISAPPRILSNCLHGAAGKLQAARDATFVGARWHGGGF